MKSIVFNNNNTYTSTKLWSHYGDVIMTTIASQITSLTVVYSIVYSGADQRKHQSSASLAFVQGIHRGRWIPRTKGQLRGKCFHLMTSSWMNYFRNCTIQNEHIPSVSPELPLQHCILLTQKPCVVCRLVWNYRVNQMLFLFSLTVVILTAHVYKHIIWTTAVWISERKQSSLLVIILPCPVK